MIDPYQVVRDFEQELCDYTGAPYCVSTNSCTMALLITLSWWKMLRGKETISCPKRTYVSVPQSIKLAGHRIKWRDEDWLGMYALPPTPIWDCARLLTSGMYKRGTIQCLSFHWSKHLQIGLGGAILHDRKSADPIFRRMRFDGRTEGLTPDQDSFPVLGYHAYLTPGLAADGLMRLSLLPEHNEPLPNSPYPDLSQFEIFA
jgi:dTDP-4-amino-4,6-dideoxygalactose transaminase